MTAEPGREEPDVVLDGIHYTVSEWGGHRRIGPGFLDLDAATRGDATDFVDRVVNAVEEHHEALSRRETFRARPVPSQMLTLSRMLPLELDTGVTVTADGVLDETGMPVAQLAAVVTRTLLSRGWLHDEVLDAMLRAAEGRGTCRHCGAPVRRTVEPGGDYPGDNEAWRGADGDVLCDVKRGNQEHQPGGWTTCRG